MNDREQTEVCKLEFTMIKDRLDRMETRETERESDLKTIEKAIVAIQVANEHTARTLEKMDIKMDAKTKIVPFLSEETKKQLIRAGLIITIILIIALIGTNVIEGLEALNSVK